MLGHVMGDSFEFEFDELELELEQEGMSNFRNCGKAGRKCNEKCWFLAEGRTSIISRMYMLCADFCNI